MGGVESPAHVAPWLREIADHARHGFVVPAVPASLFCQVSAVLTAERNVGFYGRKIVSRLFSINVGRLGVSTYDDSSTDDFAWLVIANCIAASSKGVSNLHPTLLPR